MVEEASSNTINLAVVRGTTSGLPVVRLLPSGSRLAAFALRTHAAAPPATSIPIAVWDPPGWLEAVEPGDELIVAGSLRRRFYRAATGALGARVEVEAAVVGHASDVRKARRVRRLSDEALDQLG